MKAFRIISVTLFLLLSVQSVFAGRYYDSETGRWLSPDPLAHKYPGWSPYNYVTANPMRLVDKDGREGDDYLEALYANRENLSSEGQEAFDQTFTTTMSVEAAALGGTYGAIRYGPAIGAFISTNANKIRNFVSRTFNGVKDFFNKSTAGGNFSRSLKVSDLGIKGNIEELKGTFSISEKTARITIDMIKGEIKNPFKIIENIKNLAQSKGATTLEIKGTIANEKLYEVLQKRYNMISEGADDIIKMVID
ncbi:MAG: RHS repeat-associated core domain-containing protein [Ignavibacteria bacterium]|jgi:uncharacterized protein RhaS with RHS repeats